MIKTKICIVGSNSDLINPLVQNLIKMNYDLICITKKEWDLEFVTPNEKVIQKIKKFNPNQLIYAAGLNMPLDIKEVNKKEIQVSINKHLSVNCLSFLSLTIELLNDSRISLTGIHVLSSLYGVYGRRTRLPYCISKHALEASIKCLALEYPETQIIGYRPGFFDTKLTAKNISEETKNRLSERIPLKRFGSNHELSNLIFNNINNPNSYLTGTCITIDGGMTSGGFFET